MDNSSGPPKQLTLFSAEDLGLMAAFARALTEAQSTRKWTRALHHLTQLGIELPGACDCALNYPLPEQNPLHGRHGDWNARVRAIIQSIPGARQALRKALDRDLREEAPVPERPDLGRIAAKVYGELLADFLRAKPTKAWFREPTPSTEGAMYQGQALEDQRTIH